MNVGVKWLLGQLLHDEVRPAPPKIGLIREQMGAIHDHSLQRWANSPLLYERSGIMPTWRSQLVAVPAFHNLASDEPENVDPLVVNGPSCGGRAKEDSAVGTARGVAHHHLVAFSDYVVAEDAKGVGFLPRFLSFAGALQGLLRRRSSVLGTARLEIDLTERRQI
jgi:hypothetical protein